MKTAPMRSMNEDSEADPYVVKRRRLGLRFVAVSIVLVALGIVWAYQRDLRRAAELDSPASPAAGMTTPGSVGTSGTVDAPAATDSGSVAVVPPAIIQELDTITGSVGGQELVGRRVDLHVTVHSVPNEVVFWIGGKDNRVLVALGRDNRDGRGRQHGLSPRHGILTVHAGQQATISGSLQRLPKAEEIYGWRLTEPDYAELLDRKMYIRADTVTTDGHGSHGVSYGPALTGPTPAILSSTQEQAARQRQAQLRERRWRR
jgi:hypothetical protein